MRASRLKTDDCTRCNYLQQQDIFLVFLAVFFLATFLAAGAFLAALLLGHSNSSVKISKRASG